MYLCGVEDNQELPDFARNDALNQIKDRCHIRSLGDLYLPELSLQKWWGQLEKLHSAACKMMS